jgi:hypothetical protein
MGSSKVDHVYDAYKNNSSKLNDFNGHTHEVFLDSKDMLRFHVVGRLQTGTNSYVSNLDLSIIACYPGFQ